MQKGAQKVGRFCEDKYMAYPPDMSYLRDMTMEYFPANCIITGILTSKLCYRKIVVQHANHNVDIVL